MVWGLMKCHYWIQIGMHIKSINTCLEMTYVSKERSSTFPSLSGHFRLEMFVLDCSTVDLETSCGQLLYGLVGTHAAMRQQPFGIMSCLLSSENNKRKQNIFWPSWPIQKLEPLEFKFCWEYVRLVREPETRSATIIILDQELNLFL